MSIPFRGIHVDISAISIPTAKVTIVTFHENSQDNGIANILPT